MAFRRHSLVDAARRSAALAWALGFYGFSLSWSRTAPAPPNEPPAPSFSRLAKPILSEFCIDCHGPEKPKAGLNLQTYGDNTRMVEDRAVWEKVREMLESREMPPPKKPQPSEEQRYSLTRFIDAELSKLDCHGSINLGHVTLR